MEGVLVYSNREHGYVLADKKGKFQKLLRAGQQLYIYLCSVWVPVILQYSEKLGEWYFKYLPNVQVNGCKAMLKAECRTGLQKMAGNESVTATKTDPRGFGGLFLRQFFFAWKK